MIRYVSPKTNSHTSQIYILENTGESKFGDENFEPTEQDVQAIVALKLMEMITSVSDYVKPNQEHKHEQEDKDGGQNNFEPENKPEV